MVRCTMDAKRWALIIGGILAAIVYIVFSMAIRDTELIWLETRLFGLLAFGFLFLTVLVGELRLLTKIKADFTLFKYHTPFGIASLYLVMLHFIAALADNYKWGPSITIVQYLGFSFSDHWLVLLSLGTLTFYVMIIVAFTSATRAIQFVGYKRWKLIHYLGYATFIVAYIHAVNLGTDIKGGMLGPFLTPVFNTAFLIVLALLVTRFIHSFGIFADQPEIYLAAMLAVILVFGSVYMTTDFVHKENQLKNLTLKIEAQQQDLPALEQYNLQVQEQNAYLSSQIMAIKNG
jgi:sulfoxide reductase heme-binding subunit YedZ